MFQSRQFVEGTPASDEVFTDALDETGEVMPPKSGSRRMSLLAMRYEMIGWPDPRLEQTLHYPEQRIAPTDQPIYQMLLRHGATLGAARKQKLDPEHEGSQAPTGFSAAVFIGGTEGVEREFHIFRSFHPDTPALPIGSTGSACQKLLQDVAPKMVEAS